jgi:hypothetical protein
MTSLFIDRTVYLNGNVDIEENFSTKHTATAWRQSYCSLLVWRFCFVPVRSEPLV